MFPVFPVLGRARVRMNGQAPYIDFRPTGNTGNSGNKAIKSTTYSVPSIGRQVGTGNNCADSPVWRMIIGEPVATNPIYLEIIDFFASGTTPQAVVDFQPSLTAQHRALELLDLAKEDRLTAEQESELEHFTELEHILRMAKARARQILAAKQ